MKEKISFSGKSKDFLLARKLCEVVSPFVDINHSTVVAENISDIVGDFDSLVCRFGTDINGVSASKIFTYSVGQSNADICGLNFQKREQSRSLELLSGSFMGRVNIPVSSEYTETSVLYCAAGLMASGVSVPEIIKAINSKIS